MTGNTQKDHRLLTLLRSPVISEKATRVADKNNQIVFDVLPGATKEEIGAAVELIFKVEVQSVQVLNRKGKVKRHRQIAGRCKATRKAYVSLKPGQDINFEAEVL